MRQKFQDLMTLLKRDRKTQVIAIAVVFALMFLIFAEPKRGMQQRRPALAAGSGATTTDERYDDLVVRFNSQLEALSTASHETSVRLDQSIQRGDEYEKRTAEIFRRILERIAETEAAVVNASLGGSQSAIDVGDGSRPGGAGANGRNANGAAGKGGAGGAGGAGAGANGAFGPGGAAGAGGAGGLGGAFGPGGGPGSLHGGRGGVGAMASNGYGPGGMGAGGAGYDDGMSDDGEPDAPEPFGFEDPQIVPPPAPQPKKVAVVGAGDSVKVKLLAGVNAPTDGTPYPVVFQLSGDVTGPDGSSLPLGEARLIAAAQGSLTDSRALFRLSSLNIRLPNGRRKIFDVDGWIVGEDGKRGMEGLMIDPLSKIIGGVAAAGAVDGLGQAISQQQISIYRDRFGQREETVTGNEFAFAGGKALQQSSREWSSIIRERANQLVPHVEVLSGREGTAVFSKSFTITDLYEVLEQGEEEGPTL